MTNTLPEQARGRGLLLPSLLAIIGLGILLSLGTWQLQRKAWKEGLLDQIAARTTAEPVSLTTALRQLTKQDDIRYMRVRVRGRFRHNEERYVYAPDPKLGPGVHVYTPLEITDSPWILLVNRGYVPTRLQDPAKRAGAQIEGETEFTGLIRWPENKSAFSAAHDPKTRTWYWRDHDGISRSISAGDGKNILPFFLDAEVEPPNAGGFPKGGVTRVKLTNRHLEYALTWFGLAATLAGVFGVWAWGRRSG